MFEEWNKWEVCLKEPRPNDKRDQNFSASWRNIVSAQTNFPHDQKHYGNPERNANDIVKRIEGKMIWEIWFDDPAICEIQNQTKQEQRIGEVAKSHNLNARWEREQR
jgi:hypothetical protein